MYRIALAIMVCLLLACNGDDKKQSGSKTTGDDSTGKAFGDRFRTIALPYQLSDTALFNNRDTTTLPALDLSGLVQDSVVKQIFGKTTGIKYTPLAKTNEKAKEAHYIVKAVLGNKKAALLMVVDRDGKHSAATPFLVPDGDDATSQVSSIDKSYVVTKVPFSEGLTK